ncbi:Lipase [Tolypocladium ophioglossoides CBS 100239]|uniref:Lipase n=1 Tax=Tolypocladium ophioglossoides (strain CBS 100239) TaxID=1163406 RepID=A0A0L0NCF9_TOLOC|nr:Lipase [Tolypocladium ophioglossoides CBS 100239]
MKTGSLLALAAVAVGGPVGSIEDYVRGIGRRNSVLEKDYGNLKFYVQHAAAAYCNLGNKAGQAIACRGGCPGVEGNKATILDTFVGEWSGVGGYVAVDHARREIVLAIRGSSNMRNFITDVVFAFQDCDLARHCKVHAGFAAAWAEMADSATRATAAARAAHPGYRLVVTGHSLGGAVATLAAAYLGRDGFAADAYTFGAPRVGNDHFASFVSGQPGGQWRVTHRNDPIPRLAPIVLGYRHVSPEYWLPTDAKSAQHDYRLGDIEVCAGIANTTCNAGTFGFNVISHLHYLGNTAGCAPFPLTWKRHEQLVSHQELEQRLNEWSQKDQDYVKSINI